jgi:LCP family protein required for cell wall assembly
MTLGHQSPTSRYRRRRPVALTLGGIVGAALLSAFWWLSAPFLGIGQTPTPAVGIHKLQSASWRPELGDLLFVAVLGSDARSGPPNAGGGCDAVHIIAINPRLKAGTILNFPRDSFLAGRKLTDICRTAGMEAAVDILRSHTGLPIQYYATTEFTNFMRLIDAIGGVEINVPYPMNDAASAAFFPSGPRHMLGGDVLAFSRNRKDTPRGDFSRTENQGVVMLAVLQKFRAESGDWHRMFDYIRAARKHIHMTIPVHDLLRMVWLAREIDTANVQNITVPGSTGSVGAASVVFLAPGDTYDRVRDDGIY